MLFPRLRQRGGADGGGAAPPKEEQSGCWDAYGVTGAAYATRLGAQMAAVRAMIAELAGV